MQDKGFIKVPRGCVFQDIFKDRQVFYFYFMLLYLARYKAGVVDGIYVSEGQVLITKKKLAEYTALPEKDVRALLERFERYGCITKQNIKNKYTLITLLPVFADGKPLEKIGNVKRKSQENETKVYYPEPEEIHPDCEEKTISSTRECNKPAGRTAQEREENKLIKSDENYSEDKKIKESVSEENRAADSMSLLKRIQQKMISDYENGCSRDPEEEERRENSFNSYYNNVFSADKRTKDTEVSGQRFFSEASRARYENACCEKLPYGKFANIYLTAMQYEELKSLSSSYDSQIERLSAYLKANPSKKYEDHFALLCLNIEKDKLSGGRFNRNEECTPDPTASYDIKRAELRARTSVPVVKKRNRETGLWEPVKKSEE